MSYLVHFMMFSSRPFYDSPRGRWAFRLLCEAFFLYIFHSVQLAEREFLRHAAFFARDLVALAHKESHVDLGASECAVEQRAEPLHVGHAA